MLMTIVTWLICNFVRHILNQASPHHGEEKTRIGNCWNILRTGGKLGRYLNSWRWVVFPHRLVVHPIETLGRACAGIHPGKLEEVGDPAGGAGLGHLQPQNELEEITLEAEHLAPGDLVFLGPVEMPTHEACVAVLPSLSLDQAHLPATSKCFTSFSKFCLFCASSAFTNVEVIFHLNFIF